MNCEKHGEQSTICRFCDAEVIELNEEQWAHFAKTMAEDREPTPAMRRAGYRHRAMVKAKNEGRLSLDTMQEIFAEADREFDASFPPKARES